VNSFVKLAEKYLPKPQSVQLRLEPSVPKSRVLRGSREITPAVRELVSILTAVIAVSRTNRLRRSRAAYVLCTVARNLAAASPRRCTRSLSRIL
jgi:hypothetical protein